MPVILRKIMHPINCAGENIQLNIDFLQINDGEFIGLMDAGAGGSSVLGKILCGLIRPRTGELSRSGADGKKPGTAAFFEGGCEKAIFETSVEKEVCRRIRRTKAKKEELLSEAKAALELVGFDYESVKEKSPFDLSRGERRRIALAAALALRPELMVLNDPMRDMDGLWCEKLMELLKKINRQGTTVILLSSETSRLAEAADRIIIMKDGRIVIDSSAKNVFSEYYGLIHLGLPVPEVRKCCQMLREQGMDMPNNIILYDQFIDRLKILMWRKNR